VKQKYKIPDTRYMRMFIRRYCGVHSIMDKNWIPYPFMCVPGAFVVRYPRTYLPGPKSKEMALAKLVGKERHQIERRPSNDFLRHVFTEKYGKLLYQYNKPVWEHLHITARAVAIKGRADTNTILYNIKNPRSGALKAPTAPTSSQYEIPF